MLLERMEPERRTPLERASPSLSLLNKMTVAFSTKPHFYVQPNLQIPAVQRLLNLSVLSSYLFYARNFIEGSAMQSWRTLESQDAMVEVWFERYCSPFNFLGLRPSLISTLMQANNEGDKKYCSPVKSTKYQGPELSKLFYWKCSFMWLISP